MVGIEVLGDSCKLSSIIIHHLYELDEKDKDVEELFVKFCNTKEVIPFVSFLKEEGNYLFKQK